VNDEEQIKEALKPFLFKKVTPNMITKINEALSPVLDKIVARRAGEIEVVADSTNNTEEDTKVGRLNVLLRMRKRVP